MAYPYPDENAGLFPGMSLPGSGMLTQNAGAMTLPQAVAAYRKRASDLYGKGEELYNSDPDMSSLQDFARERGAEGDRATLNALAAQFAGESFQPIQATFLKKAAAATEPMKLGSGLLTGEGKYIKDPFAERDKRAEFLLNQAKAYEQIAATAQTAQERADAEARQRDISNQLRLMGLGIQQMSAVTARNNSDTRANNQTGNWRAEDNLRKDFDTLTKDLREELNATGKITQIISATPIGTKPDAITQQSLVILLNKFLDPGSVVREGEFDRVVKAQGLEGQAKNLADRILRGQPLDANTIQQINGLAALYQQAAMGKMQTIAGNYRDIATRRGLSVESVISDPRFRGAAPSASGAPVDESDPLGYRKKKP